jgi:hypothetical protein
MGIDSVDLERIDKEIEVQTEEVRRAEIRAYDKLFYGKGPWNELKRLKAERDLILKGVKFEHYGSGTVLVEDSFVYSLKSGKWKAKGESWWFRSKNLDNFINLMRSYNENY